MAERTRRVGRMNPAQSPAMTRSIDVRFGARSRDRLRISSCCLTSNDSAATDRRPPGPNKRAVVTIRLMKRMARSRTIPRAYRPCHVWQVLDFEAVCAMNYQFAPHTLLVPPLHVFTSVDEIQGQPRCATRAEPISDP